MARFSPFYLWIYGLTSVFIKGAAHIGMVILSGSGIAQMIDTSGAVAQAVQQPLTLKYFSVSLLLGGGFRAMAYLDDQPLPKLPPQPVTNPPFQSDHPSQ